MSRGSKNSDKPTWRRYDRPGETARRDEDGRLSTPPQSKTASKPAPKPKPKPKPADSKPVGGLSAAARANTGNKKAGVIALAAAIIGVPLLIGVIVGVREDNDTPSGDFDTSMLDVSLVEDGLQKIQKAEGRDQVVSVVLSQYDLSVEYYDSNADQRRTYSVNDYRDGYRLQVSDNEYDDYRPRPFDIDEVSSTDLVDLAKQAIDAAHEPYSFDVTVEVDYNSREPQMTATARAYGDGDAEIVTDLDGNQITGD